MNDPKPGLYRHYKGGLYHMVGVAWPCPIPLTWDRAFTFLYVAKHSETQSPVSVYCETISLKGEEGLRLWTCNNGPIRERLVVYRSKEEPMVYWARPLEMWESVVVVDSAGGPFRFTRIGD